MEFDDLEGDGLGSEGFLPREGQPSDYNSSDYRGEGRGALVDLLEIFHARQLKTQILAQLRRLTDENQHLPLHMIARRREVVRYYEALLLTVVDMLHQLGDHEIAELPRNGES